MDRIHFQTLRIKVKRPAGVLVIRPPRNLAGGPEAAGDRGWFRRVNKAFRPLCQAPVVKKRHARRICAALRPAAEVFLEGIGMQVDRHSRGPFEKGLQPARVVVVAVAEHDRRGFLKPDAAALRIVLEDKSLARVEEHLSPGCLNPVGQPVFTENAAALCRVFRQQGDPVTTHPLNESSRVVRVNGFPLPSAGPPRIKDMLKEEKPVLVMAGATGFVGTRLRQALREDFRLVCLTRSRAGLERQSANPREQWRQCDLFSLLELEQALAGADYAVYLVHSMMPSARLLQGSFQDLDLIMADNFARAARLNGIRQILYLGGLIPTMDDLSPHLASRLEVEQTLGSGGVPVTALRAGLIVGPGGSSFRIVVNLVKRLPVMILPEWTRTRTQPIAIDDILRAFREAAGNSAYFNNHYDLGGPDVMTYREMLGRTARILGKRRFLVNVPVFSAGLSKLWVAMLGGASRYLVGPLVDSLRHPMVATANPLQAEIEPGAVTFEAALRQSVDPAGSLLPNPRDAQRPSDNRSIRRARRVRSVQRMPLPFARDARWVAREYFSWLPKALAPLVRCIWENEDTVRIHLVAKKALLIEFTYSGERSSPDRQLFYITGGLLARTRNNRKGRIEFREILDRRCLLVAIHDFTPMLPWYLYSQTQARFHLWVMGRFRRYLSQFR